MNEVYLIRRKSDGHYYRGAKKRHGKIQRSAWPPEPRKAWKSWQWDQCERFFGDHFPKDQVPDYEVVTFLMVEQDVS